MALVYLEGVEKTSACEGTEDFPSEDVDRVDEAHAEICQLRQTIQSRQNDVDFSRSRLEVQHENDRLQR